MLSKRVSAFFEFAKRDEQLGQVEFGVVSIFNVRSINTAKIHCALKRMGNLVDTGNKKEVNVTYFTCFIGATQYSSVSCHMIVTMDPGSKLLIIKLFIG